MCDGRHIYRLSLWNWWSASLEPGSLILARIPDKRPAQESRIYPPLRLLVDVEAVSAVAISPSVGCGRGSEGSPAAGGKGAVLGCGGRQCRIGDICCCSGVFAPGQGESVEKSAGVAGFSVVDE